MNYAANDLIGLKEPLKEVTKESLFVELMFISLNKVSDEVLAKSDFAELYNYKLAKLPATPNLLVSRLGAKSSHIRDAIATATSLDQITQTLVDIINNKETLYFLDSPTPSKAIESCILVGLANRSLLVGNELAAEITACSKAISDNEVHNIDNLDDEQKIVFHQMYNASVSELRGLQYGAIQIDGHFAYSDLLADMLGFGEEIQGEAIKILKHLTTEAIAKVEVEYDYTNTLEAINSVLLGIDLHAELVKVIGTKADKVCNLIEEIIESGAKSYKTAKLVEELYYQFLTVEVFETLELKPDLLKGVIPPHWYEISKESVEEVLLKVFKKLGKAIRTNIKAEGRTVISNTPKKVKREKAPEKLGSLLISGMRWGTPDTPAKPLEVLAEILLYADDEYTERMQVTSDIAQFFEPSVIDKEAIIRYFNDRVDIADGVMDLTVKEKRDKFVNNLFDPTKSVRIKWEYITLLNKIKDLATIFHYAAIGNSKLYSLNAVLTAYDVIGLELPSELKPYNDPEVRAFIQYASMDYIGEEGTDITKQLADILNLNEAKNNGLASTVMKAKKYYVEEKDEVALNSLSDEYLNSLERELEGVDLTGKDKISKQLALVSKSISSLKNQDKEDSSDETISRHWVTLIRALTSLREEFRPFLKQKDFRGTVKDSSYGKSTYIVANNNLNTKVLSLATKQ